MRSGDTSAPVARMWTGIMVAFLAVVGPGPARAGDVTEPWDEGASVVPAGGALRLPDPWRLLDVVDPWAGAPDAPRGRGRLRTEASAEDLFRDHRGVARHDYYVRVRALALSTRLAPGRWVGAAITHRELVLGHRGLHGRDDRLDGGALGDDVWVAGGVGGERARVRVVVGAASEHTGAGVEGSLRSPDGVLRHLRVRLHGGRSDLALRQRVDGVRVRFGFPAEVVGGEVTASLSAALGDATLAVGARHLRARDRGSTSRELLDGWGVSGAIGLVPPALPTVDLRARGEVRHLTLALTTGGIGYAGLDDLVLADGAAEAGLALGERTRLAAGVRRVTVDAGSDGFADVWPFTPWDLFSALRYRLDVLTADFWAPYLALSTERALGEGHTLGIDLALERWMGTARLRWRERVAVLPPFFYTYLAHEKDLALPFRHAGRVEAHGSLRAGEGLRVWGRIGVAVPLDELRIAGGGDGDGGAGSGGGGGSASDRGGAVWGGVALRAGVVLDW